MLTTMSTSLHHRAIEHLGTRIIAGELPAGHVMLAEHLEDELKVSRSVVREAVRVLQSLGLVETIKRVGIRVLPASRWNPFDPLVIRWRLAGEGRGAQLRSLAELRTAVEPVAAELAAGNAPAELRSELVDISHAMRKAGEAGDVPRFLELDIALPFAAADRLRQRDVRQHGGAGRRDAHRAHRARPDAGPPSGFGAAVARGRG